MRIWMSCRQPTNQPANESAHQTSDGQWAKWRFHVEMFAPHVIGQFIPLIIPLIVCLNLNIHQIQNTHTLMQRSRFLQQRLRLIIIRDCGSRLSSRFRRFCFPMYVRCMSSSFLFVWRWHANTAEPHANTHELNWVELSWVGLIRALNYTIILVSALPPHHILAAPFILFRTML